MINRKSELSLTTEQKNLIGTVVRDQFREFMRKKNFNRDDIQYATNAYVTNLYYQIGMIDYNIYAHSVGAAQRRCVSREDGVASLLLSRAGVSAMLQIFEEEIGARGKGVDYDLSPKILQQDEPITVYHGTAYDRGLEPVSFEEIGRKTDGRYKSRDGIIYMTPIREVAEKYANFAVRQNRGDRIPYILESTIEPGECKWATVHDTDGGVFARKQDELVELANSGVKYIIASSNTEAKCIDEEIHSLVESGRRSDILDISNFSDFVKERDEGIISEISKLNMKLPGKEQSLAEYAESIPDIAYDNAGNIEKRKSNWGESIRIATDTLESLMQIGKHNRSKAQINSMDER